MKNAIMLLFAFCSLKDLVVDIIHYFVKCENYGSLVEVEASCDL